MTTFAGYVLGTMTVPSGVAIAATNSGGGPTSVGLTAGTYTPVGLVDHFTTQLNTYRPASYPLTAANMARAAGGYGTWASGWLCDESSGSLAAAFGSPSLTAGGSPTYSNAGPRGGTDYAINFSTTSDYFDGGNNFNLTNTGDICFAAVCKFTSAPSVALLFAKGDGTDTANRWAIYPSSSTTMSFEVATAGPVTTTATCTYPTGEWFVLIATIDRATGKGRIATKGLTSGTASVGTEVTFPAATASNSHTFRIGAEPTWSGTTLNFYCAYLAIGTGVGAATGLSSNLATAIATFAAAASSVWAVTLSTTTGLATVSCPGAMPFTITWTSTALRDVLGFASTISAATSDQTSTKQARFLWIPDRPLHLMADTKRAPVLTDLRTTTSPKGVMRGFVGNAMYRHERIGWSRVDKNRVWEVEAATTNGTWETFIKDAHLAQGHSWGTPVAPITIYDHSSYKLGNDASISGWYIEGVTKCDPQKADAQGWAGQWNVEIPALVSSG